MKVSVIMPTANRPEMLERAIQGFLAQDWEDKELIICCDIFDDNSIVLAQNVALQHSGILSTHITLCVTLSGGLSIGNKRNEAVQMSSGEIILHMDDDDFYAPDWITKSVTALIESDANMTGLSSAYFYKPETSGLLSEPQKRERFYQYNYRGSQPYAIGASMCYYKKVWEKNKFKDISEGEDGQFCAMAGKIVQHKYIEGFCAILHGANTASHKQIWQFKELPLSEKEKVFGNLLR